MSGIDAEVLWRTIHAEEVQARPPFRGPQGDARPPDWITVPTPPRKESRMRTVFLCVLLLSPALASAQTPLGIISYTCAPTSPNDCSVLAANTQPIVTPLANAQCSGPGAQPFTPLQGPGIVQDGQEIMRVPHPTQASTWCYVKVPLVPEQPQTTGGYKWAAAYRYDTCQAGTPCDTPRALAVDENGAALSFTVPALTVPTPQAPVRPRVGRR